jgi:hypothetical protein
VRVQVSCRRKAKVAATGRGHGRRPRGRQRPALPGLQGEGSDHARSIASPRACSRWSPNCAATSARPPRSSSSGRPASRSASPSTPRRRRSPWACLMTPAELEELERKVTELEKRALVSTACSTLSDAHDRPSSRCAVNVHPAYGNSGKTVVPRRARAMIS